ncbi:MAG: ferritin-like domain-containing protein [Acidimicrobiia bacterium]
MEVTERELRRMVDDVEDVHRQGMATMGTDIAELHNGEGKRLMDSSRRRFLAGAGLGGLGLVVGSAMVPWRRLTGPAFAQVSGDAGIAAFAESVELAAVAAYEAAGQTGKVTTPAVLDAATTFAMQHQEHAAAFGGAAGEAATGEANPGLVEEIAPQIQAAPDEAAILEIAFSLENAAASTYLFALGALESTAALQLTASILPVESQHAVVIGAVLGKPATAYVPTFETQEDAISPEEFPV